MSNVTELPRNRVLTVVLDALMEEPEIDAYKAMFSLLRGVESVGETRLSPEQSKQLRAERRSAWKLIMDAARNAGVFKEKDRTGPPMVCEQCLSDAAGRLAGLPVLRTGDRCAFHPGAKLIEPNEKEKDDGGSHGK